MSISQAHLRERTSVAQPSPQEGTSQQSLAAKIEAATEALVNRIKDREAKDISDPNLQDKLPGQQDDDPTNKKNEDGIDFGGGQSGLGLTQVQTQVLLPAKEQDEDQDARPSRR